MSAVAAPRVAPAATTWDPRLVRGGAFLALATFAGLHWATLVEPPERFSLFVMAVVALLAGSRLAAIEGEPRLISRIVQRLLVALAVVVLVLWLAKTPTDTLRPDHWDQLFTGIGNGLAALPGLRIPYRGTDEWTRVVLLSGGGLLLALAAWPAMARRPRTLLAAVLVGIAYTVPIVEQSPRHPYLDGALFAFLLAAYLWADRLRGPEAPLAGSLVALAVIVGAIAAPHVDARRPWIDYEAIAESLQAGRTTAFSWNHTYAPLTWPRDGREMLRIKAPRPTYWKAETLEEFDGEAWRQVPSAGPGGADTEGIDSHPGWIQRIEVTVRGLRSTAFVAAGTTLRVDDSSRLVGPSTPGTFHTLRKPLRRGDGYIATSYVPRPDEVQMRTAGTDYPAFVRRQLAVEVPGAPAVSSSLGSVEVTFPSFRSDGLPTARLLNSGFFNIDADTVLRRGPYGRMYALAQQLASASTDPYDFARRVQARVRRDAKYTEIPPDPGRLPPLVAFLFRDHAGYCQHFSGAMALLLRMGGVPARVATGFAPGSPDGDSRVVRDVDAHSWVEVYFPGIGWATFDPTPADSPARGQIADLEQPATAPGDRPQRGAPGDRTSDPTAGGAAAADGGGSSGPDPLPLIALGVLAALLIGTYVVLRRRGVVGPIGALDELRRALVRSGRSPTPDLTLHRIEAGLGGSPDALAYLRALRVSRYGGREVRPTPGQRRALRQELGAGLGLRGRLRALWALPPRTSELLEPLKRRRRRPYTG